MGLLAALAIVGSAAHATLIDLGTLGGSTSQAWGVRSDGTVVVGSSNNGSELQAFAYNLNAGFTGGTMVGLSTLVGGNAAEARAVNAAGVVAGYSRTGQNAATERAVVWNGVTPTQLTNVAGGTTARAYGISDAGTTVGWVTVNGVHQAFVHSVGTMTVLALDSNQFDVNGSEALGISPNGRYIVGKAISVAGGTAGETHGFVYDTQANTTTDVVSSANTIVWGVSNNYATGQESGINSGFRLDNATFLSDGATTPHGGAGIGYAVNNAGVFVGTELDGGIPTFAWVSSGFGVNQTTTDLNTLHGTAGATLQAATGVADLPGVFSGYGDFSGNQHAFLLIVPEPSSAALVLPLLALAPLALRRKRRA